jgi:hypothetical protein
VLNGIGASASEKRTTAVALAGVNSTFRNLKHIMKDEYSFKAKIKRSLPLARFPAQIIELASTFRLP